MIYKVYIYAPDDDELTATIINAAASAGAGRIGNYAKCAFVTNGWGQWKADEGAAPYHGKVGEISRMDEVQIEMRCPVECASAVKQAVIAVHPFEEVNVEFIELVEVA